MVKLRIFSHSSILFPSPIDSTTMGTGSKLHKKRIHPNQGWSGSDEVKWIKSRWDTPPHNWSIKSHLIHFTPSKYFKNPVFNVLFLLIFSTLAATPSVTISNLE